MFVSFIAPVFLMPIFNQYKPMEEGPLKTQILSMARANSIPADNVYQFDASKQSNRISANVSGIRGSPCNISAVAINAKHDRGFAPCSLRSQIHIK
jgi:STE24 endopeptidase